MSRRGSRRRTHLADVNREEIGRLWREAMSNDDPTMLRRAVELGYEPTRGDMRYAIDTIKPRILEALIVNHNKLSPYSMYGWNSTMYDYVMTWSHPSIREAMQRAVMKRNIRLLLSKKKSRTMGDEKLNDNSLWRMVSRY